MSPSLFAFERRRNESSQDGHSTDPKDRSGHDRSVHVDPVRTGLSFLANRARAQLNLAPTVGDLVQRYLTESRAELRREEIRPNTMRARELGARHLVAAFGDRQPGDLTAADYQTLKESFAQHRATWKQVLTVARWVGDTDQAEGWARANPARRVTVYKRKRRIDRYQPDQQADLAAALERIELGTKRLSSQSVARCLQLALWTGARSGELRSARWDNVWLDRRLLILEDTKSAPIARFGLCDQAIEVLLRAVQDPPISPWVFPGDNVRSHVKQLHYCWERAIHEAGLPYHCPHTLRHSWVTTAMLDLPLSHVSRAIGHSDSHMTATYGHLDAADVLPVVQAVGARVGRRGR